MQQLKTALGHLQTNGESLDEPLENEERDTHPVEIILELDRMATRRKALYRKARNANTNDAWDRYHDSRRKIRILVGTGKEKLSKST